MQELRAAAQSGRKREGLEAIVSLRKAYSTTDAYAAAREEVDGMTKDLSKG